MSMLQVGVIGVLGVLFAVQFKSGKSEYAVYISVAVSLLYAGKAQRCGGFTWQDRELY